MRVQWLGDRSGADRTIAFGREFQKGKPIDIDDDELLAKAKGNPTFKVEEGNAKRTPRGRPRRRTKH